MGNAPLWGNFTHTNLKLFCARPKIKNNVSISIALGSVGGDSLFSAGKPQGGVLETGLIEPHFPEYDRRQWDGTM